MAKKCNSLKKSVNVTSDFSSNISLKDLVHRYLNEEQYCDYSSNKETYKSGHILYLNSLTDKLDFICGEHNNNERRLSHKYLYNGHQYHLQSYHANENIVDKMISKLECIDNKDLSDFEKLYDEVKKNAVPHFGNTCIYDFSLRYGWHNSPRIEPKEYVYVHSNPLLAAKQLSKLGYIKSKVKNSTFRIPFNDFSEDIRQPGMSAQDIEHFLCVFKDEILKLTK